MTRSRTEQDTNMCIYWVFIFFCPKLAIYIITWQINIIPEEQNIEKYCNISYTLKTTNWNEFIFYMTPQAAVSYSHNGLVDSWIHGNKTNEYESSFYGRGEYLHCNQKVLKRYLRAIRQISRIMYVRHNFPILSLCSNFQFVIEMLHAWISDDIRYSSVSRLKNFFM